MHLLDVAPLPDQFLMYQEWLRRHSSQEVDTVSKGATDSVASGNAADTLDASQTFIGNVGSGGDDASTMIWVVLAVVAALALCLTFVRLYRQSFNRSLAGA